MATALSTLRAMLLDAIKGTRYTELTATGGTTTTVVDTSITEIPGSGDTDFCEGWYVYIRTDAGGAGAAPQGESGLVTGYNASNNTITFAPTMTVAPASGDTYELCQYDPKDLNTALNRAAELLFPDVTVPKRDETLFAHNLLLNSDGETFSTTFTNWTHAAGTWTQEATRKIHGDYSIKGVASGADAQLTQNLYTRTNVYNLAGQSVTLRGWGWASAVDAARLRITFDGSTYSSSSYHVGSADWEHPGVFYAPATVPTDATQMTALLEVADGNTAYFDMLSFDAGSIYQYTIPAAILKGPYHLAYQADQADPDGLYLPVAGYHVQEDASGRYIILDSHVPSGRCLRVDGIGVLSTMSSDSGTTEVDAPRTHLLVAKAAQLLYEQLAEDSGGLDQARYDKQAQTWDMRVDRLKRQSGMRSPRKSAVVHPRWLYG